MDIKTIKIRQGLYLKTPENEIALPTLVDLSDTSVLPTSLAVFTDHQRLISPLVKKDDTVKKQTPLFTLKDDTKVKFLSPVSGKVLDFLLDGRKRIGIIIKPDTTTSSNTSDELTPVPSSDSTSELIRNSLLESGLWTFFRQRPFSKIPLSSSVPSSICITAMDSDPLPSDIPFIVSRYDRDYYNRGIKILSSLTSSIFFCSNKSTFTKLKLILNFTTEKIRLFEGSYPSSLPGTHIHYLDPVYPKKEKLPWYIDIQDVIRIGKFFQTGVVDFTKIISVSGDTPSPTHVKIITGSSVDVLGSLLSSSINKDNNPII